VPSEVINWTIDEVSDLVEALIEAGYSLVEILAEALSDGINALKKFITMRIGKTQSIVASLKDHIHPQLLNIEKKILNCRKHLMQAHRIWE